MRALIAASLLLAACARAPATESSKPVEVDSSKPSAAPSASATTSAPTITTSASATTAHPATCEVEISGAVRLPKDRAGAPAPRTIVSTDDCLSPTAKVVGTGGTTRGRLFVEVFVPWGSDLTICAASEPAPGQPSTLYGKSKRPMHAAAEGEVEFEDLVIDLEPGPPKTFATHP